MKKWISLRTKCGCTRLFEYFGTTRPGFQWHVPLPAPVSFETKELDLTDVRPSVRTFSIIAEGEWGPGYLYEYEEV